MTLRKYLLIAGLALAGFGLFLGTLKFSVNGTLGERDCGSVWVANPAIARGTADISRTPTDYQQECADAVDSRRPVSLILIAAGLVIAGSYVVRGDRVRV